MLQVVQQVGSGETLVVEGPDATAGPGQVLVATGASLISAGTERHVVDLTRRSLVGKARERPQDVRRVLEKVRQEGLASTLQQVRAKLQDTVALGYSAAGVVLEVGAGVHALKPGDRVAAAAPHASLLTIGHTLCARIPDGVDDQRASYAGVGAVAVQGVRLAKVGLGDRVLVIGLGLIGQLSVALLRAQGCLVVGCDPDQQRANLALELGARRTSHCAFEEVVRTFAPAGVDAVIITAATASNAPIELAAEVARPKGRIVLVGVAGLSIPRAPFFAKELEFTVSSSLGAGRGDPSYEEKGRDYPIGYARWTVQRNMESVLEAIAAGLPVELLTTHRFAVTRAADAYDTIVRDRTALGVLLEYPSQPVSRRARIDLSVRAPENGAGLGISVIGGGNFARLMLLPALRRLEGITLRGICTHAGLSARTIGDRHAFSFATTDIEEISRDVDTDAVIVATRHDLHASQVQLLLRAGKHVFVEKPLCLTLEELDDLDRLVAQFGTSCPVLAVGTNRRFARAIGTLRTHMTGIAPLMISYRFATAALPQTAWPHDPDIGGGRLIGEACHAIDTCCAIADSEVAKVFAESVAAADQATDDHVVIVLRHDNGSVSTVCYDAGGDRSGPAERIEVFGGGRTAVIDEWKHVLLWDHGRRTVARSGGDKGYAALLRAFVDACRDGRWPASWDRLYASAWATLAAARSLRDGVPVSRD
jgi:predicted dehydrogenase